MNKFLYALRSIGITIVGVVIAVLVTSGLHQLFSLFLDPLPMEDLMAADWAGRSNIMETYMAANPFAIYSMLIAHSFGSALAVYWYVRATKVPSWRTEKESSRSQVRLSCSHSGYGAMYKTIFTTCL